MSEPRIKIEHHVFKVEGPPSEAVEVYTTHFLRHFASTQEELVSIPSSVKVGRSPQELVEIPRVHEFVKHYEIGRFVNRTLVLAYYLFTQEGKMAFDTSEINRLSAQLGKRRPRNLWDTVSKNIEKGYIGKTGNKHGNRVELYLTDRGKFYIEDVLIKRRRPT